MPNTTKKHEIANGTRCPRCIYDLPNCICPEIVPVTGGHQIILRGAALTIHLNLRPNYREVSLTVDKGVEPFLREEFFSAFYNHETKVLNLKTVSDTHGYTAEWAFTGVELVEDYDLADYQRSFGDCWDEDTNTSVFV